MSIQLAVSPAGFLGSPYGHFQVVGPDGNEIEVQPSGLGTGDWVVTIRNHDTYIDNPFPTPDTYHTYGIQNGVVQEGYYNSIALPSLDGQTESQQWELLYNIAHAIEASQENIQYQNEILSDENGDPYVSESGTQNSNTFISTLLYVIGIDLADYVPSILQGQSFGTVPGYTHNVLFDPLSGEPISLTLSGTDGNDFIRLGNGNDTVIGSLGNDTLDGGGNADGSEDSDTLDYGQITTGLKYKLLTPATGDTAAVYSISQLDPANSWTDTATNFETTNLTQKTDLLHLNGNISDWASMKLYDGGSSGTESAFIEIEAYSGNAFSGYWTHGDVISLEGLGATETDVVRIQLDDQGDRYSADQGGNHVEIYGFDMIAA